MSTKQQLTANDYLRMPWHFSSEASQWEGEDGFWVSVAELPECSTFAPSIEDGLSCLPSLLYNYLKVAIASKAAIPVPEEQNKQDLKLAGKLLLRIPPSLHLGIKNAAKREKVSINQFALRALTEAVTKSAQPVRYPQSPAFDLLLKETKKAPVTIRKKSTNKKNPKI